MSSPPDPQQRRLRSRIGRATARRDAPARNGAAASGPDGWNAPANREGTTARTAERREIVGSEEVEAGAAERLTFFSDAVSAIALTLLAIDLPAPAGTDAHDFWSNVSGYFTEYLAFVISFVTIASHWSAHHRIFRFVARADDRLRGLAMVWLFGIVLIPFATRVVAEQETWGAGGSGPVRFGFYSAVQVLTNGAMVLMLLHMRQRALFREDTPRVVVLMSYWRSATMAAGFLISIPLFLVWNKAWIIWIVTPVVLGAGGRQFFTARLRGAPDSDEPKAPDGS